MCGQTSFCLAELSTNEAFHSLASFLPISKVITLGHVGEGRKGGEGGRRTPAVVMSAHS